MKIASQQYRKLKLVDVKTHPRNPRKGSLESIAQSLEANDFYGTIVVQKSTGYVLAGNHRLLAAKEAGAKELPAMVLDVDDATALRILLADNRTSDVAEYDDPELLSLLREIGQEEGTLDGTGWTFDDFRELEREADALTGAGPDEDEAPPLPAEPRSKLGEVYELGPHRLLCGDATSSDDAWKLLEDERGALLFTSPPYLDAREYTGKQDLEVDHLAEFLPVYASSCDLIALNLGLLMRDGQIVRYWDTYLAAAESAKLKLLAWNVWNREDATNLAAQTLMTFPTWHEFVFVFGRKQKPGHRTLPNKGAGQKTTIGQRQPNGDMAPAARVEIHKLKRLGSVLTLPSHKGKTSGDHPAVFPVGLPAAYLESLTEKDEIVVDPFAGTGSTLIAAEQLGRRCFAMELEPAYCDVIRDRYDALVAPELV